MAAVLLWTQMKQKEARKHFADKAYADSLAQDSLRSLDKNQRQESGKYTSDENADNENTLGEHRSNQTQIGENRGWDASSSDSQKNYSASLNGQASDSVIQGQGVASDVVPHRIINVETPEFSVVFDTRGAKIHSLRLKTLDGKEPFNDLLIDGKHGGALDLQLGKIDLSMLNWRLENTSNHIIVRDNIELRFTTTLKSGRTLVRSYTIRSGDTRISHRISIPESIEKFTLKWNGGLNETELLELGKGVGLTSNFFSEVALNTGSSVLRETVKENKTFNAESGVLKWVGLRRRYVAVILNFNRETTYRVDASRLNEENLPEDVPHTYSLSITGENPESNSLDFDFIVLPLKYKDLVTQGESYENILFSGWEWFFRADIWYVKLCGLILKLLNVFHGWIPNYGIAIILLTLLVRLLTLPLSISQTRSAAKMAIHAPAIKSIRDKFKGDAQKQQQEIMAYYKTQGVNPLGGAVGCMTGFVQMPIFISLFHVLGRAVELRGQGFFLWIHDLSKPDVVLPALKIPYLFPIGLTVLPFFMSASMYFLMKLTIKDPQQKAIVWLMPIMMFVFSCSFPSGLVLYWTISNVFSIAQTHYITKGLTATVPPNPNQILSTTPLRKKLGK